MKTESMIERRLEEGRFVVTSELGPPKSADADAIRKKAQLLKGVVDAVNITDNQTAIVRMSSIAAARICIEEGLEPVMQMTCRDRNRIGLQSDLLGAYALGIKNVLALTGDHQCFGNHPESKNVFDIDSIQLVSMIKRMRDEGKFLNGEEIRNSKKAPLVPPRMFIGAAANPFADPFEFRVIRLAKKVAAGADFIQTQCVFDLGRFKRWMAEVVKRGLHERCAILAGIMPVRSARALTYMAECVPGITIPESIIVRMNRAAEGVEDKKERAKRQSEEGVKIAVETIQAVREMEGVRGVHIMAVEWERIVPTIVEQAGLRS